MYLVGQKKNEVAKSDKSVVWQKSIVKGKFFRTVVGPIIMYGLDS